MIRSVGNECALYGSALCTSWCRAALGRVVRRLNVSQLHVLISKIEWLADSRKKTKVARLPKCCVLSFVSAGWVYFERCVI